MTCRSGCEKTELEDQIASLEAGIEHRDAENAALRERLERHRQASEYWNHRTAEEWQRAETLRGQVERMRNVLRGVQTIMDNSKGVAGWHLNGDIANWDEFEERAEVTEALSGTPTPPDDTP